MSINSCGLGHGDGPLSCGIGHNRGRPLRELYSPKEAEHILSISHATLYRLINAGRLDARKIDGKTVITAGSIRQFVSELPKVAEAA
jgi:hypothetical protein